MRHRVKKAPKLNRQPAHRQLLTRNLATSLVTHGQIETTIAKARAVQPFVERLIANTKAKPNAREAVRYAKSVLFTELAQKKLVVDLAPKYANLASGFTRITPVGVRKGDATVSVIVELI